MKTVRKVHVPGMLIIQRHADGMGRKQFDWVCDPCEIRLDGSATSRRRALAAALEHYRTSHMKVSS